MVWTQPIYRVIGSRLQAVMRAGFAQPLQYRSLFWARPFVGFCLGLGICFLASCASSTPPKIDYRGYEKLSRKGSIHLWRKLSELTPGVRDMAFYGNWGGPGSSGGEPVDWMDEGFRRHDIVYFHSFSRKNFRAADEALINWLENGDTLALDGKGRVYRIRSIRFFRSRFAAILGKPPRAMLWRREAKEAYFQSPEDIDEFFDPNQPGFPE